MISPWGMMSKNHRLLRPQWGLYATARLQHWPEWGNILTPLPINQSANNHLSLARTTKPDLLLLDMNMPGDGRSVLAQPEFLGLQTEVYVFVAVIFFIFSYAMSFASYRLEAALGVGKR